MKKIIIAIAVILAAGMGVFVYTTRPVAAPTEDINTHVDEVNQNSDTTYQIKQEQSSVQFSINETLNGKPFTAIGTTNQIAGTISLSNNKITVGTITMNATTLKTDSVQRDGAIVRFVLHSDQDENEFITFVPTNTVMTSTTSATVTGNLTISGITKPTSFAVTFAAENDTLNGTATTTLKRSDFELAIPNIPFVANVSDTFTVTVNIVAKKI